MFHWMDWVTANKSSASPYQNKTDKIMPNGKGKIGDMRIELP